ncbi:hypothetical protein EJB05_30264 [Eragrostis curvula]|uniref:Uncharacterized protein n=1 Tax=Eragrostis curvula TaxID=38414 RepID=A0A5J9UH94_9POAL|nr:hypothetical protein EJB05_30264 [Eragrostis curvula]
MTPNSEGGEEQRCTGGVPLLLNLGSGGRWDCKHRCCPFFPPRTGSGSSRWGTLDLVVADNGRSLKLKALAHSSASACHTNIRGWSTHPLKELQAPATRSLSAYMRFLCGCELTNRSGAASDGCAEPPRRW